MSRESSSVPWKPWLGVLFAIFLFLAAQLFAGLILMGVTQLGGWSASHSQQWLSDSLIAKILFFFLTGAILIISTWRFLVWQRSDFKAIGLRRPKWSDPLYSLAAFPVYILTFVVITAIAKALVPSLDLNQAQDLGFNETYHGLSLVAIGLALVVIAPITEEIIFRGLLYGSLKKGLPIVVAATITSLLFAAGHLLEGGSSGLLYIAGIDTFVLSLILIYLREKSGGLWASIGLHALKNGIAFVSVFVIVSH